jgi:cyclopropane fatty-acyl-phospholipid synthase-like methyltransferase
MPDSKDHEEQELTANWNYSGDEALYQLGTFGISSDLEQVAQNRYERADRIAGLLNMEPRDVVLDLGSGMGFMAERMAPKVARVHCADVSETYMHDCRARVGKLPNVETHVIPYADLSALRGIGISKAYSALLFIHFNFHDLTLYLREVHSILEAGGLFFFDFNDSDSFRYGNALDSFNQHIGDYRRRRHEWVFGCMHMISGVTLRNILPQLGFRIAAMYPSRSAFTEIVVQKV